jgi:hypothetical protein
MDLTAQIYERARQLWDEALDIFLCHNLRVEGQVQNESFQCGLEGQHSLLHGGWAVIAPREILFADGLRQSDNIVVNSGRRMQLFGGRRSSARQKGSHIVECNICDRGRAIVTGSGYFNTDLRVLKWFKVPGLESGKSRLALKRTTS